MRKKLFVFGTGKLSEKYTQIFNWLSIEIEGYIDNDRKRWGTEYYGKLIYPPDELRLEVCSYIFIACAAKTEITKQLKQMKLEKQIISFYQIIQLHKQFLSDTGINNNAGERVIIIDNLYGRWGGAEDWCHIVARSLIQKGERVFLIENKEQLNTEEGMNENVIYLDIKGKGSFQVYKELVDFFCRTKPFLLINIWNSELLLAAATVKCICPNDVSIISNVLNDGSYEVWCEWNEITDSYICISSKIKRTLVERYKVEESKVYYIPPFIEKLRTINRKYNLEEDQSIKIGYPCRLSRDQKRADLLPRFIGYLESKKVNYVLNIAGDGLCKADIEKYIEENQLDKKAKLYGKLTKSELIDFLNNQDVYLNFSEYEGTSLTMLEAMASGCVPVVTNVSGVDDFIESGVNGLTADVGDLEQIAEYISYLDQNRELLAKYGCKCVKQVHEKCRLDKYIDDIEQIIGDV